MATMEQSNRLLSERLAKLETTIETERPHLATKSDVNLLRADMERQTRLLVMWFIATQIAISLFLYTALTGALG